MEKTRGREDEEKGSTGGWDTGEETRGGGGGAKGTANGRRRRGGQAKQAVQKRSTRAETCRRGAKSKHRGGCGERARGAKLALQHRSGLWLKVVTIFREQHAEQKTWPHFRQWFFHRNKENGRWHPVQPRATALETHVRRMLLRAWILASFKRRRSVLSSPVKLPTAFSSSLTWSSMDTSGDFGAASAALSLLGLSTSHQPSSLSSLSDSDSSEFAWLKKPAAPAAWDVQFHPHGGQFDFVWLSARTPRGAYVW